MTGWYGGDPGSVMLLAVLCLVLVTGLLASYLVVVRSSGHATRPARSALPQPRKAVDDYDEVDEGQFVHQVRPRDISSAR